jgi:hypothetical protein
MLEIDVVTEESFDEEKNEFVASKSVRVVLEHSLVTLSKWESVWERAFLSKPPSSSEEVLSYIEMMIQGGKLPPEILYNLVKRHIDRINDFIKAEHSATRLPDPKKTPGYRETVTAELIRYWMLKLNIPPEYDRWHLNRLITLIRVVAMKDTPQKKRSLSERRDLNRARLKQYNTTG